MFRVKGMDEAYWLMCVLKILLGKVIAVYYIT